MLHRRGKHPQLILHQQARRYASESTQSGGSNAILYSTVGIGAIGLGAWYFNGGGKTQAEKAIELTGKGPLANEPSKVFKGGEQGFMPLTLDKIEDINHNTKKFRFKFEDSGAVSGLHVASALLTKFQKEGDEKPTVRPYTPTSDEDQRGFLDFIIKKYPDGPMSEHIHALKPGDSVDIKGPIPKYAWDANKHKQIALIAGGTGITPMWQLCRAIFKNPEDKTKVTLIFGNVTKEDMLLKKEFDELENNYPDRFRAFYVLDNPPEGWKQGKGFITKDLLKETIPGPKEENIKVFVCGPPGLYNAISGTKKSPSEQGELTGYLKELGYGDDQVYKF